MTFLDMPAVSRNFCALNELRGWSGLGILARLDFHFGGRRYFTQKGVIGDFGHIAVWPQR